MTTLLAVVTFGFTARSIQWAAIRVRAAGYLLVVMIEGAWARRSRWPECVEQARRDV